MCWLKIATFYPHVHQKRVNVHNTIKINSTVCLCTYKVCSKNKMSFSCSQKIFIYCPLQRYNTLMPMLFSILEALIGIVLSSSSDVAFISWIIENLRPFMGLFSFGYRKNIYLIINIYIVPLKVIPFRYNTLLPVLFPIFEAHPIRNFWYSLELIHRCSFCLLNRIKSPSFHGPFQVLKQEKAAGD